MSLLVSEAAEEVVFPPGDLWSDEPPMESDLHRRQMEILISSLEHWLGDRQDFYVSGNLTIYYSPNQLKSEDFRGPDFFAVLATERRDRRSWVVWQEDGKYPNIIIEVLSDSTADVDRGLKKQIYQDIFRTPDYFWFDPKTLELTGFHLVDGQYQELVPTGEGQLSSRQLGLNLGIHEGRLRFFSKDGELVPLVQEVAAQERERADQERERAERERERAEQERERADQERERADQERERAEQERARADALVQRLRELGIDP